MGVGYTAPWPDFSGSFVNYMDLYDPIYGLDPTKDYEITIVEYNIMDHDDGYDTCEVRCIIIDWVDDTPGTNIIYAEEIDVTGWGASYYAWQDPITLSSPRARYPLSLLSAFTNTGPAA